MLKPEKLDNLVKQFQAFLPEDMRQTKHDVEKNIKAMMKASFQKMDLVTREEFEIQSALLVKTRCLLDELEEKVKQMEKGNDISQS
jgi:ubiquinone biosynthesis accessory factor UbiK